MGGQGARSAVVLLSGGLDSATTLAIARRDGYACWALSFDYGQRHRFELDAARRLAEALGAREHRIVRLDLSAAGGFGRSALTDRIEVPKDRALPEAPPGEPGPQSAILKPQSLPEGRSGRRAIPGPQSSIPPTYVPARNTIFLSIALGYAEVTGSFDIFIGVNAIDFSGYPDCRPEFIEAFGKLANLATAASTEGRFRIHAPLIHMTKAEIIRAGLALGVDYSLTHSCYDPSDEGLACGRCDACRLRLRGFAEAGMKDPGRYQRSAGNRSGRAS